MNEDGQNEREKMYLYEKLNEDKKCSNKRHVGPTRRGGHPCLPPHDDDDDRFDMVDSTKNINFNHAPGRLSLSHHPA